MEKELIVMVEQRVGAKGASKRKRCKKEAVAGVLGVTCTDESGLRVAGALEYEMVR